MKFYRVELYEVSAGSQGFSWHTTKRAADKARTEFIRANTKNGTPPEAVPEVKAFEVEPTKAGILRALNIFADHADNG